MRHNYRDNFMHNEDRFLHVESLELPDSQNDIKIQKKISYSFSRAAETKEQKMDSE
jgi:hypothetical protein